MTSHIPGGVTLFNPFDLMYSPVIIWLGQIAPKSGSGLLGFKSPVLGIRAGMKDAHTKVYHDGLNTLDTFIPKFAPPSENHTEAYIAFMCGKIGIGPHDPIDLSTPAKLVAWALAISEQEVGLNPASRQPWFPATVYQEAANMVLGLDPAAA